MRFGPGFPALVKKQAPEFLYGILTLYSSPTRRRALGRSLVN